MTFVEVPMMAFSCQPVGLAAITMAIFGAGLGIVTVVDAPLQAMLLPTQYRIAGVTTLGLPLQWESTCDGLAQMVWIFMALPSNVWIHGG